MTRSLRIGAAGERIARGYLRSKGFAIRDANWSTTFGEIDIIAQRGELLVFVEVKTRRSPDTEAALEAVTPAKHERMLKAIYHYLHERDIDAEAPWRIDVIAVAIAPDGRPRVDHVEDAFDW